MRGGTRARGEGEMRDRGAVRGKRGARGEGGVRGRDGVRTRGREDGKKARESGERVGAGRGFGERVREGAWLRLGEKVGRGVGARGRSAG